MDWPDAAAAHLAKAKPVFLLLHRNVRSVKPCPLVSTILIHMMMPIAMRPFLLLSFPAIPPRTT